MRYHIWLKDAYTDEIYDVYVNAEDKERAKEYIKRDVSDDLIEISEDIGTPMYYNHPEFAEFANNY